MNDQIQFFTLQLREHLAGLREVSVQGRWDGPAPASLPRAVIATRLLVSSTELLGMSALRDWLQILLDLLNWVAEHPQGALAGYEPVLREVVAFEESLIDGLDGGRDLAALVSVECVERLQHGLAQAAREAAAAARARTTAGTHAPARLQPESVAVRLEGLDDPRATVSWQTFLALVERLVTKVPHLAPGEGDEAEAARAQRQARWRQVRALGDALFETEDDGVFTEPSPSDAADPFAALPELPGGELFSEAFDVGWREGLATLGRELSSDAEGRAPWTLRWRVPGMTVEGAPPGAPGVDDLFPTDEQRRYGRLLGLMAVDLCATTGPAAPRWLLLVDLGAERVTAEFRRPAGRLPAEAVRALEHLLEEDFLIEAPNLRGALRRLKRDGALVHAHFGPRGMGHLQIVLPLRLVGASEVCVLPLTEGAVAAPLHIVEASVSAEGWQRRGDHDGETLVKEGQQLLAADLAAWVDGLLPAATGQSGGYLALVGLVEKRVALLTSGPARRAKVVRYVDTPPGWEPVAARGVELADGTVLPLLDVERVLALRLRRAELSDGVAGSAGTDAAPPGPEPVTPSTARPRDTNKPTSRILLVVASRFRAGDLEEKLTKAGYAVTVSTGPAEAHVRLQAEHMDAIVCDNAEPARCLEGLRELLDRHREPPPGPIILAAGSAGEPARRLARRLGADGVWAPPYLVEELRPQLI